MPNEISENEEKIIEENIINESPEISVGENIGWTDKILTAFPAFNNRNYKLYFSGQLISLVGTWLQVVAQSWLVLQLTNSAFLIGLVAAIATSPSLFLSLFGGVIVDRFPKKKIIIITQISSMLLAFTLGILTVFKVINVTEIAILAFLLGVVNAVDAPARQSFVPEMVGKDNMASAIALNSGMFNAARVIGPGVAGILIALVGSGGAFILNGVSYIAVIIALLFIKAPVMPKIRHASPLRAIKEGVNYSFSHPIIRVMLIFVGMLSIFGFSYTTIMPVIAQNIFHIGASGLGYLYSATGLGALTAAILVSAFSKRKNRMLFIFSGTMLFTIGLILFTFTNNLPLALPFLFLTGMGLIMQFSSMNTTIQESVDNNYRGRVMSIYTLMFMGLSPVGNFEIGFLAERLGSAIAIRTGIIVVVLFAILIFLRRKNIIQAQRLYMLNNN